MILFTRLLYLLVMDIILLLSPNSNVGTDLCAAVILSQQCPNAIYQRFNTVGLFSPKHDCGPHHSLAILHPGDE